MSTMTAEKVETLDACFGTYPHTQPLKNGDIKSDRVVLRLTEVTPVYKAFLMMVREQKFDVCEMALVTYLQAKAYGKPLTLMPATMMGRFQHGTMLYNSERGTVTPESLPGRRVGVRSFAQTTGVLAARHSVEGLRPRSRQGEMGDVRGRASGRIPRPARRRARRRGQGHDQDGARRRARRRDLRRQYADRPAAQKRHPRSRSRGEGLVQETRHRAGQPYGRGQEQPFEVGSGRGARSLPHAAREQARPPACRNPAPSTPSRSASMR